MSPLDQIWTGEVVVARVGRGIIRTQVDRNQSLFPQNVLNAGKRTVIPHFYGLEPESEVNGPITYFVQDVEACIRFRLVMDPF